MVRSPIQVVLLALVCAWITLSCLNLLVVRHLERPPAPAPPPAKRSPAAAAPGTPPTPAEVSSLGGTLASAGSDSMINLMNLWGEAFGRLHPRVRFQIEGKGSATAPAALIAGTAQLGPMTRSIKQSEIGRFEARYGYRPTVIRVALDALAVLVHRDNPLQALTLAEVDAVFSRTRRAGHGEDVKTWDQLGLHGEWAGRTIHIYGRNSASGTYGFFKERVLRNGDFKHEVREQPGSASVVEGVSMDRYGIGYCGMGYLTAGVRALPLVGDDGEEAVKATEESVHAGAYPLSRYLFIAVNKAPGRGLDPLTREFLRFVLSREGQVGVAKDGYYPLSPAALEEERAAIE